LESKGYKIKLNVMDNQCTKQIKKFLTDKDCELMFFEPHNHRVNAAKRAIQTFKDHFSSALATTDSKFPLQLWDRLTSQVETTLNLMRDSQINPGILAYKA
jgi:replicative superfamily II helicase